MSEAPASTGPASDRDDPPPSGWALPAEQAATAESSANRMMRKRDMTFNRLGHNNRRKQLSLSAPSDEIAGDACHRNETRDARHTAAAPAEELRPNDMRSPIFTGSMRWKLPLSVQMPVRCSPTSSGRADLRRFLSRSTSLLGRDVGEGRLAGAGERGIAEAGVAGDPHRLADVEQDPLVPLARLDVATAGGDLEVAVAAARQNEPHRLLVVVLRIAHVARPDHQRVVEEGGLPRGVERIRVALEQVDDVDELRAEVGLELDEVGVVRGGAAVDVAAVLVVVGEVVAAGRVDHQLLVV